MYYLEVMLVGYLESEVIDVHLVEFVDVVSIEKLKKKARIYLFIFFFV